MSNNLLKQISRTFLLPGKKSTARQLNVPLAFILVALIFAGLDSCQKPTLISHDPSLHLEFSNDSVIFDTVFTTLGSAIQTLRVYNHSSSNLVISNIKLEGGSNSPFRMNVDGEPTSDANNIELRSHDSLYIFARVTIDPNNATNPFVVQDSILFQVNGNNQYVRLVAWGKNARYILADHITSGFPPYKVIADSMQTTHWDNKLPYVIYGYAVVDAYGKLIIDPGTHIYFHKNAGLWIFANGQLDAEGTIENPIVFQGDRLDTTYASLPGQWDRIWIMEGASGKNNIIKNAVIKNAYMGIQAESFYQPTKNQLILDNVIIKNMNGAGIFTKNYNITAQNVVVGDCGGYCMALTGGGNYQFIQSTFANYWPYSVRNNPAVLISNYTVDSSNQEVPNSIHFSLGNSIIYGYNNDEFGTQMISGADSAYFLDHCLVKTTLSMSNGNYFNQIIKNKDPLFTNTDKQDYRIDTLSPAIKKGDPNISVQAPYDILGNPRGMFPDLGAYQFVPNQSKK
ncbi:MAG: hypothetical protein IH595_10845 [Bacteroidales bacterium]|nr:hypothetical protein [Bacteroidales bacterium]